MQFGLVISVILHAAILGWAFVTIQSQRELRMPEPDPIITGLVTEGELTKLRQGARTAKQLEAAAKASPKADIAKKEAAKPKPVAAAPAPPPPPEPPAPKIEQKADPITEKLASVQPPPPPPPAAPPPPAPLAPPPAPAPDEQKKLDAMLQEQALLAQDKLKADEQRIAEEKRRADEERKAEEQRRAEEQRKLDEQRKADEQRQAEEQKRLEEQRRQAELKKKADEEKKRKEAALKKKRDEEKKRQEAEAKQKQFDAEKISALLNKVPNSSAPPPSSDPTEPTKAKGPALGAAEGRDQRNSASELARIGQIIRSCVQSKWNVLSGGESAQQTLVKIRLRFNLDGTLATPPTIMNPQITPYFLAISESALRAVQDCEPFNLPAPMYESWKDIVVNFQPKDMY